MVILLPLLVSLIGLLMYVLAANPKVQALGKDMFWVGLLAFLLTGSSHMVEIVR